MDADADDAAGIVFDRLIRDAVDEGMGMDAEENAEEDADEEEANSSEAILLPDANGEDAESDERVDAEDANSRGGGRIVRCEGCESSSNFPLSL